ncbi:beta-ketoacyl-[acyl-carrier-protein] synthase family protein [Streptomyces sp. NPDC056411]|uniref:beta-ketoacyl-[acyl-carrier-protein] synthase family protein n=1 Tax=Streptomyces sp. NPDC056411 TaxID=3345813 RepID=UPI0035DE081A
MGTHHRSAAITGIGVVAPGGTTTEAFWALLTSGTTATREVTHFDASRFQSRIAAEADFDAVAAGLTERQGAVLDRAAQFALAAAGQAVADSGLTEANLVPERTGVVIGSAVGCTTRLEEGFLKVSHGGERGWVVDEAEASPELYDQLVPSSIPRDVAWRWGAEGPVVMISTGCTSGIDAVGHAARLIEEGSADIVIAGATDAPISPISMACFDAIKATSRNNEGAATASRPFDKTRDGFVMGEGAAVFVLEEAGAAARRGAHVYAGIAGYANRGNAYHMTGLRRDGKEMAEAITVALDRAGLSPEDVDYINAHGSGTKQNDRHETAAFKRALGQRAHEVPVSSIKSMVGHSLGAIGSIEIAACALAIEHGVVPPTANLTESDPECDLDYVPRVARRAPVDVALTVGSGFGGFQSAMLLQRPEPRDE